MTRSGRRSPTTLNFWLTGPFATRSIATDLIASLQLCRRNYFQGPPKALPVVYTTGHVYHDFHDEAESAEEKMLKQVLLDFYSGEPMAIMDFRRVNALNSTVYSVKVFGVLRVQIVY